MMENVKGSGADALDSIGNTQQNKERNREGRDKKEVEFTDDNDHVAQNTKSNDGFFKTIICVISGFLKRFFSKAFFSKAFFAYLPICFYIIVNIPYFQDVQTAKVDDRAFMQGLFLALSYVFIAQLNAKATEGYL